MTLTLYGGETLPAVVLGGRVALAVDDIHEAHRALIARHAEILKPPYELAGCWHLEILDPDRNVVILHQRKDGSVG